MLSKLKNDLDYSGAGMILDQTTVKPIRPRNQRDELGASSVCAMLEGMLSLSPGLTMLNGKENDHGTLILRIRR